MTTRTCALCERPRALGAWVWCVLPERSLADCQAYRHDWRALPDGPVAYCRQCHRRFHAATHRLRQGAPGDIDVDELVRDYERRLITKAWGKRTAKLMARR